MIDAFPAPARGEVRNRWDGVAPLRYQLIVEGALDDESDLLVEGFTATRADDTTSLTGVVRDQAELHGLLRRMSTLGLTVLEVTAVDAAGQPIGLEEQVAQQHQARRHGLRW